ncbi:MAG: type IV pilin protein [Planctomycetota bacterium]|jgi:prepilin-type N-terminal cleavage/methylation domain-containing protein
MCPSPRTAERGFTAVELIIVIAVIGLIAALAIPHLRAAKIHSNEVAASASLRTIARATEQYRSLMGRYPGVESGDGLADLAQPGSGATPLIDEALGSGTRGGYLFQFSVAGEEWACVATPSEPGRGSRSFYLDQSGLMRVERDYFANDAATSESPFVD